MVVILTSVTFSDVDVDGGDTATEYKHPWMVVQHSQHCTAGWYIAGLCNISGVTVLSAAELRVIAVQ